MKAKQKAPQAMLAEYEVLATRAVREALDEAKRTLGQSVRATINHMLEGIAKQLVHKATGWNYSSGFEPDPGSPIGKAVAAHAEARVAALAVEIRTWRVLPSDLDALRRAFQRQVDHNVQRLLDQRAAEAAEKIVNDLLAVPAPTKARPR